MNKPVKCGCGGETFVSINGFIEYHVVCALCGMRTDWFRSKDKAIEVWNRAMGERTAKVIKEDNICICDNCSGLIFTPFASYKYCPECGVKLDWSEDE